MATLTAARAAAGQPVPGHGFGGNLKVAWGTYDLASNPTAADIAQMCRVPKNATVVGGWLMGEDLDTNATETIDIDFGWAANGVDAADPDGFGNFGVQTGDVSVHLPVAGIYLPLAGVLATDGPKTFSAETVLQAVFNVAAATGGTGRLTAVVLYTVP